MLSWLCAALSGKRDNTTHAQLFEVQLAEREARLAVLSAQLAEMAGMVEQIRETVNEELTLKHKLLHDKKTQIKAMSARMQQVNMSRADAAKRMTDELNRSQQTWDKKLRMKELNNAHARGQLTHRSLVLECKFKLLIGGLSRRGALELALQRAFEDLGHSGLINFPHMGHTFDQLDRLRRMKILAIGGHEYVPAVL